MSRPSAGRRLCAAVSAAQRSSSQHLRALRSRSSASPTATLSTSGRTRVSIQDGVSADVIGQTSRALSRRPQLVGTAGRAAVVRVLGRAAALVRARRVDAHLRRLLVEAARRQRDDDRAVHAAARDQGERRVPVEAGFGEVVEGYNAFSPSGRRVRRRRVRELRAAAGLRGARAARHQTSTARSCSSATAARSAASRRSRPRSAAPRACSSTPIRRTTGSSAGPVYPDGPWRPADGIQRGSIQYIFNYPGDPLTPGTPAIPGTRAARRRTTRSNLPRIPTTPISYGEAQPLLEGARRPGRRPESFQGGLPITYHVGPGGTQGAPQARHRLRADAGARRAA